MLKDRKNAAEATLVDATPGFLGIEKWRDGTLNIQENYK